MLFRSVLSDATVNMIPAARLLRAAPTNGGVFATTVWNTESLGDIMYWQTGHGHDNKLVLAPTRDQLVVKYPLDDLKFYPRLDSGSNVIPAWPVVEDYRVRNRQIDVFTNGSLLPGNQNMLTFLTPGRTQVTPVAAANMGAYLGTVPDATTSTFMPYVTIPVLPAAKYIARLQYIFAAVNESVLFNPFVKNGVAPARWAGTSALLFPAKVAEAGANMLHLERVFRATASGANGQDVGTIGFQIFGSSIAYENEPLINMHMLRYSDYGRVGGTFLDTTVSHKYSLFARTDYADVAVSYTLTVIAEDGSTIGTDTQTISNSTVTKFEVNIPSGNKSAWAYLTKTTNDWRDTRVYIYGYGITLNSVSTYLDLLVSDNQDKIYA